VKHRIAVTSFLLLATLALAQEQSTPVSRAGRELTPNLVSNLARPLRYRPDGGDFVIVNGPERFNRPLYGGSSPFRVDAGDKPEFSLYLPGRGGVLRLALARGEKLRWLSDCDSVTARYRRGTMVYEIRDSALGDATLQLTALVARSAETLLLRAELQGATEATLVAAFGGITGERGRRDGDIGTEPLPVAEFFAFRPEHCRENTIQLTTPAAFTVSAAKGSVAVTLPEGAATSLAAAEDATLAPVDRAALPLGVGRFVLRENTPVVLALEKITGATATPHDRSTLASLYASETAALDRIAQRVSIETPDDYLNAVLPSLNIAADAVWDERQQAYLHGAVAWRTRLLGWRVSYAGDALGWHERTRAHFDGFTAKQNTGEIPTTLPAPEASANLARNETALHSNGDLTNSHYDMNLVALDAIFRHLRWTGDLDYARRIWPVIERSLAWERRLFRREFGPGKLPLYEAYAAIWASDDLTYSGGGTTHTTAYNLFHHREAARLARLLGLDATPYETEAAAIARALDDHLWLPRLGWFAESKDLLGLQLTHPSAAAWTVYHTLDSRAANPLEAWQLARYVDTALPRFPLRGPGVPPGNHTIATSDWMPYTWSINNVVFAESVHTALALWQVGRTDSANRLFKGAVLDSMFLGLCPGNVGMATAFDANRRESQRDFGDGAGVAARTVIEGLFGLQPDLLAHEIVVQPGFPHDWSQAAIRHPDFSYRFERRGTTDRYQFTSTLPNSTAIRLRLTARSATPDVTVDGHRATWRNLDDAVGAPRIEIIVPPGGATNAEVAIDWQGAAVPTRPGSLRVVPGEALAVDFDARVIEFADPQSALASLVVKGPRIQAQAAGVAGHRTAFARLELGALSWWQPLEFEIVAAPAALPVFTTDWRRPLAPATRCDVVDLSVALNDRVTEIFRHDYTAPRSPHTSLALARNAYGTWTHPNATFTVDDSGLRTVAAAHGGTLVLPNGVPLATPSDPAARNIAFVSRWANFPAETVVPLSGRARKLYLLMAGSTWAMQSRLDNGEVIVTYTDGSITRLALENPTTWWPIDQDYFIDEVAFARPGPLPLRVDLKTGAVRVLEPESFKGRGRTVPGGAATVLDLTLDPAKELRSLTVRAVANDVVIGLMSATLERPFERP